MRKGLDVSAFSLLNQLSTVFTIILGIVFLKEALLLKKVIGAILIIFGNIISIYKTNNKSFNKYHLFGLIGNLSLAIAVTIDVGISKQFQFQKTYGLLELQIKMNPLLKLQIRYMTVHR